MTDDTAVHEPDVELDDEPLADAGESSLSEESVSDDSASESSDSESSDSVSSDSEASELEPSVEAVDAEEDAAPEVLPELTPEQVRADVEALLYLATEPLAVDVMAELIGANVEEVTAAVEHLRDAYAEGHRGLALREVGVGWRMSTAPVSRGVVERFVLAGRSGRLTQAALETLAVVAYKQPIQRADVSDIRGVNADGAIRSLVARGLVQEVGRAEAPGQPILYGTTPLLLEKLGLTSLDELPDLADHLPEAAPDEPRMDDLARARRLIAEGKDLPATGRSRWDPDAPPPMPPPEPRRTAGADDAMDELSERLEAAAKSAMVRLQQAVRASEDPDEASTDDGEVPVDADDPTPADPTQADPTQADPTQADPTPTHAATAENDEPTDG